MPITADQRRAKGYRRVELLLHRDDVAKLDEICAESGYSRADIVETMIQTDYETLVEARRAFADGAQTKKRPRPKPGAQTCQR